MYAFIMVIHVIACLILITAILLQSGKGGGLAGLFGSGTSQTIFGARASTFLTRLTTSAAIAFLLTCISLTVFSSRRVKSLMTGVKETAVAQEPQAEVSEQTGTDEVQKEGSGAAEAQPEALPE